MVRTFLPAPETMSRERRKGGSPFARQEQPQ
jgi:hypothetical protein